MLIRTLFFVLLLTSALPLRAVDETERNDIPLPEIIMDREAEIDFVQKMVLHHLAEIQVCHTALFHNLTMDERKFVEDLIAQHEKAKKEVLEIAQKKNIVVSETLPKKRADEIANLNLLNTEKFNEAFLAQRIDAVNKAMDNLINIRAKSSDERISTFVDQRLTSLRDQLERARELKARY